MSRPNPVRREPVLRIVLVLIAVAAFGCPEARAGFVGACCLPDGSCISPILDLDCDLDGGEFFPNQTCGQVMCDAGTGVCCFFDGSCVDGVTSCDFGGVFFPGLTCFDVFCPPLGACCVGQECFEAFDADGCAAFGGVFHVGLGCLDAPCASCVCERDGDGAQVDVFDLLAYLSMWFAQDAGADIDGAPGVSVFDLLAFLQCWFPASAGGPCP